jgi:peptidyl-prolyl cis-trans isomerase A (cyclophilin A)
MILGAALMAMLLGPVQEVPAAMPTPAPTGPRVRIETSLGSFVAMLRPDVAPNSTENFLAYVRSGHYAGTVFHRVIPDFMIQGGGYDARLEEKPTRDPVRSEARNGLRNSRGSLALARTSDPHSAAAQFFVNLRNNHRLDFGIGGAGYTVFGQVVEGMEVVDRIAAVRTVARGPHENVPEQPVTILSVTLLD